MRDYQGSCGATSEGCIEALGAVSVSCAQTLNLGTDC